MGKCLECGKSLLFKFKNDICKECEATLLQEECNLMYECLLDILMLNYGNDYDFIKNAYNRLKNHINKMNKLKKIYQLDLDNILKNIDEYEESELFKNELNFFNKRIEMAIQNKRIFDYDFLKFQCNLKDESANEIIINAIFGYKKDKEGIKNNYDAIMNFLSVLDNKLDCFMALYKSKDALIDYYFGKKDIKNMITECEYNLFLIKNNWDYFVKYSRIEEINCLIKMYNYSLLTKDKVNLIKTCEIGIELGVPDVNYFGGYRARLSAGLKMIQQ